MTETAIHLPQTDAVGLSENWLFKHCGEQHWEYLCAAMGVGGVNSEEMRDDEGRRLYPTFVAIRARYAAPLNSVRMDERFRTAVHISHYGRAFFDSTVTFHNDAARFDVEMLTTFVARDKEGLNDLHQSLPASRLAYDAEPLSEPPALLSLSRRLRHRDVEDYDLCGRHFPPLGPGLGLSTSYEPSPYSDYNGAGLLYFAAYPTITDTLERRLIHGHGLTADGPDWALRSSTVARDVFYYRNLNLGEELAATLKRFDRVGDDVLLHTSLAAAGTGAELADVFTLKRVTA